MKETRGICDNTICQICQQEMSFGRIQRHIKSKHKNIDYKNYINLYWKTLPLHHPCEICNKNIVYKYKTCSKKCHALLKTNLLKNKTKPEGFMSKEHIEKISKAHQGKIISIETGKKISQNSKGISRNKGNQPMLGKTHTQESKNKMSESAKILFKKGKSNVGIKGEKRSLESISKQIQNSLKKNKLEQKFAQLLDENNIEYKYSYFLKNKKTCKQFDFKIKDKNILIEIDGDYWHGNPQTKSHCKHINQVKQNDLLKNQLAKNNGYILLRFWESEIYNNPKLIMDKLKEIL